MPTSSDYNAEYYSPAANRFVEDGKPYGYVVNMFAFKRATTQGRPYFISSFAPTVSQMVSVVLSECLGVPCLTVLFHLKSYPGGGLIHLCRGNFILFLN